MESIRPIPEVPIKKVTEDFINARRVERLSERTLEDYGLTLRRFVSFVGPDTPFSQIGTSQVRGFMGSLTQLSNKSLLNVYAGLSSLWTWATKEGLAGEHIMRRVTPPKPEERIIHPLTEREFRKLLGSLSSDKLRDRALLLFLLDTGVRATELSELKICDLQDGHVRVFGKGAKEREIPLSRRVYKALSDYLAQRGKLSPKSPLFAVPEGGPISRYALRKLVVRIANRAGVSDVHPHRFRHTFALLYLRNGGDAISLQKLLGHSTLDMVKKYVELADDDIQEIHRRASPVENWGL